MYCIYDIRCACGAAQIAGSDESEARQREDSEKQGQRESEEAPWLAGKSDLYFKCETRRDVTLGNAVVADICVCKYTEGQ